MTQKEFLTNLIRDLGYKVVSYSSSDSRRALITLESNQVLLAKWKRSKANKELVTLKIKCQPPYFGDFPVWYASKARDLVNRANAFLRERKLEGVADWYDEEVVNGYSYPPRTGSLRIRSIDPVWFQAAKHLSNEEVMESPQYKVCGNVLD